MEFNVTDLESNDTINEVTKYFNISLSNLTNQSHETQVKLFNLYEAYHTRERQELTTYKSVAYVVGTLIILSNITVVISSGLILKKGQQPKSTYLLLGNVSLADTIIGISIIFGALVDNNTSSNPLCIFQIGMLVCPAMVSIFSVGLIAVDRYIYILHGLYYRRWFTTTKVRIGIVCIWMIGITLGFMPVTGWVNTELVLFSCYYTGLFPGSLVVLNSLLSIVPIIVVAVLYSIILVKALANVQNIKTAESAHNETTKPYLRIYRGTNNSKKINQTHSDSGSHVSSDYYENINNEKQNPKSKYDSEYSICTIDTTCSDLNITTNKVVTQCPKISKISKKKCNRKPKGPNKWRAITVVMLTSGSFIITWIPFFVIVIFSVFCQEKLTNPKCIQYRTMHRGPLATLAFFNSILNPLIYAWWHRGFQRSVKIYYQKFFQKYIRKEESLNSTSSKP